MLTLPDIENRSADHERGRWFDLADPLTGEPTGIRLRIAGPDSRTQRRAELQMADDLAEAVEVDGRVSAEKRRQIRLRALAFIILDWEVTEDGESLPFNTANVLRLLGAARWVEEQVDAFANDRAAYEGAK